MGYIMYMRMPTKVEVDDQNEEHTQSNMVRVPDDDKLRVLGALLDVVGDDWNVLEVQGGIDLVHHVQGRRLQAHMSKQSIDQPYDQTY